jgi:ankyrin repeat protein
MSSVRISFVRNLMLFAALCISASAFAQLESGNVTSDNTQVFDTSDYLPEFYDGALEYNLMIAATKGYVSEVERLIGEGADVDAKTSEGATPLIFAVANNNTDAVKMILQYTTVFDEITSEYETPLLIAVKNNNNEIAELLIRAGSNVDSSDNYGATPLHYASIYGYLQIVDLLLYYDASIDKKSNEGTTPLLAAIWSGYADVADLLIQNGANMEARDNDGYTPFLMAAYKGDTLMMDLLYKHKVDIYATNKANHNALTLAISANQTEETEYLLRKGDKWTNSGKNVVSPFSVISKYGRKEMVDILRKNNVPGRIKYGIDQVAVTASARFCLKDFYSGINLSVKEPFLNAGFIAGCDMKLWYTKILVKDSEHLFYQYQDKGAVAYAGLFKDFAMTDHLYKFNYSFSTSLLAGYTFGNKLKGTLITPESKFHIIPSVSFKMTKSNFSFNMGVEYLKTQYVNNGPVWMRFGCTYNYFFDTVRTKSKTIKWY